MTAIDKIGNYRILAKIGEGGMGSVYKAEDPRTGTICAVKVLHLHFGQLGGQEAASLRFRREFRAAQRLSHPNIARVFEFSREDSRIFYSMEYVDGVPLTDFFAVEADSGEAPDALNDPRRVVSIVDVFSQICNALSYIHQNLIVHRDIKPDNILVAQPVVARIGTPPGADSGAAHQGGPPWLLQKSPVVKLLDFGLARQTDLDTRITKTGIVIGTVDYMSPEQALGAEIDLRSDLYSLGVVLYELFAGRLPFEESEVLATLMRHAYDEPPPMSRFNPKVQPVVEGIVQRLLKKDAAERFQNAESLRKAIVAGVSRPADSPPPEQKIPAEVLEGQKVVPQLFSPRLVGREPVLRRLREALSSTARGKGALIFLSGESGIGKSRLLQELKKFGPLEGVTRYVGACYEESPIAFMPYISILEQIAIDLSGSSPAEREAVLPENPVLLSAYIPSLSADCATAGESAAVDRMSPPQKRFEFFRSVTELFRNASRKSPLLLLLDDLHWADLGTIELTALLARNIIHAEKELGDPEAAGSLMVLATSAESLFESSNPASRVLAPLKEEGLAEEIRLERLGREQIEQFVRSMSEALSESPAFYDWVFEESRGNPYLAIESARLYASGGGPRSLEEGAGGAGQPGERGPHGPHDTGDLGAPAHGGVQDILDIRFGLKACETVDVLSAAAVAGTEFRFPILRGIVPFSEDDLLDILDRLLKEKMVEEDRREADLFRFSHSRIRDAVLLTLPLKKKRKLHEGVGLALEDTIVPPPLDENRTIFMAEHFYEAEDVDRAVLALASAGAIQKKRFHTEGALACFLRVLEFLNRAKGHGGSGGYRQERMLSSFEAGEIYRLTGDYNKAINHFSVVLAENLPGVSREMETDALNKLGDVFLRKGDYEEARKCILKSLDITTSFGDRTRLATAVNTMGNIRWHLGDSGGSLEDFAAALALRRELKDEPGAAVCLNNIGWVHFNRGRYAEALKYFEESLALKKKIRDTHGSAQSMESIGIVLERQGFYARALKYHEDTLKIMRELGDRRGVAYSLLNLGNVQGGLGKYERALGFFEQAMKIDSEIGDTRGIAMAMGNLGILLARLGDFEEAERWMRHSLEIAQSIGEKSVLAYATLSLAESLLEAGEYPGALRRFDECAGSFRELGDKFGLCNALEGVAAANLGVGDSAAAEPAAEEALALAGGMGARELEARALLYAGRARPSLRELERAVTLAREMGNDEILYRSLFHCGLRYLEEENVYDAVELFSQSRQVLEKIAAGLGPRREKFLNKEENRHLLKKIAGLASSD
jgi:serine/threonine protein kinase/tetratricopeptide (TPR) repeat protein